MIAWRAARRDATAAEIEAALARLDGEPGLYFGCDAGIAGMHPLQATLAVAPALLLRVFADGLEITCAGASGASLLSHPAVAAWHSSARRGAGQHPVTALRNLLACFRAGSELCLLGALRFESHRLRAHGEDAPDCLGFFCLPETYWQRNAAGRWQHIELAFDLPVVRDDRAELLAGRARAASAASAAPPVSIADDLPPGEYAEMVKRAKVLLRGGSLVSLTLSQSYRRAAHVRASEAFTRLRRANPAPATFFFHDGAGERVFGASPDLQLAIQGRNVDSMPVCGTVARRAGPVGESESLRELFNEEVDAASLAVCSDAMRDDLATCCTPGSLELRERRRPMSLATVVHAVDRLQGRLRADADAWDAMLATTAPAMLTGAPRAAALKAIRTLEKSARGWYGGLIVRVNRDGDALIGTLLRAAVLHEDWAEVRTGGDLLADSDPAREEAESRHKALSLWRALGVEAAAGSVTEAGSFASSLQPLQIQLCDAGDPFPHAVLDTLRGINVEVDASNAAALLLIGSDASRCARVLADHPRQVVALGDAACHMIASDGARLSATPEHGRTLRGGATDLSPREWPRAFLTARYAQVKLQKDALPAGWEVWARDRQAEPLIVAHRASRRIGLLFRPDSVLSDPDARSLFRSAIAFAAGEREPRDG